jgi:D-alanine-D-alanine ligase
MNREYSKSRSGMKITVLTHLEREDDEKSYDVVVDHVHDALLQLGHDASILGVHGDLRKLIDGVQSSRPDLVFNVMESFGSTLFGAVGVAGLLDLLGVPHTGGGPGEYYLQEDKALTKKLLKYEDVLFPDFAVFAINADMETGGNLRMPLIVKPLRMDSSIGIHAKSIVHSTKELMQRVTQIHRLPDSALAEEYIEGREFFVSVLGNARPQAFPLIEVDFSGLPNGSPRVLDSKAKWNPRSREYKGTKTVLADIPDQLRFQLQRVALDAYRALRVRDYGRIDLRMANTGEIYVIEVNASCYLERNSEFAKAAEAAGIEYPQLIQRIVDLALERNGVKAVQAPAAMATAGSPLKV